MGCYHPTIAWISKEKNPETGKKIVQFSVGQRALQPDFLEHFEQINIPCNQCIGCRLQYSREWAIRIQKESTLYNANWFLTLTYDNENVPWIDTVNTETGEIILGNPLVPKHLTKFMKNLRDHWERHYNHKGIRFYACGEYGELNERPHYHICLMNFPIPVEELVLESHNMEGDEIFSCEKIEKIWGKGMIRLGALTWQSAAYVARYMIKKQKGPETKAYYHSKGQIPEFTRMSRMPGIAREWYEEHKEEIYKNDELFIPKRGGAIKLKPAKYFDRLYDIEQPERMETIKTMRKESALRSQKMKLSRTTQRLDEILLNAEKMHKERSRKLIRPLEV
ncbi:replication initiator protein [Sigmofec virus UA08Rod_5492]|uniref:Replication initiator protein n=1 Tax=Sigmofec virus UA08Rod_5492 TaxID=2929426 RepID=A0A976N266_9VIRU|nr:replication initiator protein [Sigmofec virus UA08Rod_5492]